MRRGQSPDSRNTEGFTKRELMDAAGLSPTLFDTVRRAARVRGPAHGGLNWVYTRDDVAALIHRARDGNLRERAGHAAAAWEALLARPAPDDHADDTE